MPQAKTQVLDESALHALADKIAPLLHVGDVLALVGDLGTGKTTFARALLRALGVRGDIPSPTFTLVQLYETQNLLVSHFDLYRLKKAGELDELGWDDALADGAVIVEWPERAVSYLPTDRLVLIFALAPDGTRSWRMEKHGNWLERL